MSIKAQMHRARGLIVECDYDAARQILRQIDHDKARQWLAKIDELDPPASTPEYPRLRGCARFIAFTVVVSLIGVVIVLVYASMQPPGPSFDDAYREVVDEGRANLRNFCAVHTDHTRATCDAWSMEALPDYETAAVFEAQRVNFCFDEYNLIAAPGDLAFCLESVVGLPG